MASLEREILVKNKKVPRFFYGTAWKEGQTSDLVTMALTSGFKAIDTANQRKHYFEEGVGVGIKNFLETQPIAESNLFLQTKFTYLRGQDHRLPYSPDSPIKEQVIDSFQSSLKHLATEHIDSYVLHGPYNNKGIDENDLEAWEAFQDLNIQEKISFLGISNVSPLQLADLCKQVKIKPNFVQNRCYARTGWDKEVRNICESEGIIYQGFSLLTANQQELSASLLFDLSAKYNKTIPQITFRFCLQLGMVCLTGTSQQNHMKNDLDVFDFELTTKEINELENIAF